MKEGKIIYIDEAGQLNLSALRGDQREFVRSDLLHNGVVGGYQSGKSLAGAVKVITKLLRNPGVPVGYYLPTYGLISDMLVPKMEELMDGIKVPIHHNKKDSKLVTPYGDVWMRSMNEPDRIISYSVGYSLVDEADVVHANKREKAMQRISSRNSYKKDTMNSIDFVSTPEGFGFMYNFFIKKANERKKIYTLKTGDNRENLGLGYIEGLQELYTEDQLQAYMNGEFVNLTSGVVYKSFDRFNNHTSTEIQKREVLHVGMDFNVGHMSAIVHVIRHGIPYALDELTEVYDTQDMSIKLLARFPGHKIVIYPDASFKNRKTSGNSDQEILQQHKFVVRSRNSNPFVRDRINSMNLRFLSNKGIVGYFVNTDKCPDYTEALEKQGYKKGEPDKTTGFDHAVDAGGYFISYRFPVLSYGGGGGATVIPFGGS